MESATFSVPPDPLREEAGTVSCSLPVFPHSSGDACDPDAVELAKKLLSLPVSHCISLSFEWSPRPPPLLMKLVALATASVLSPDPPSESEWAVHWVFSDAPRPTLSVFPEGCCHHSLHPEFAINEPPDTMGVSVRLTCFSFSSPECCGNRRLSVSTIAMMKTR